VISQIWEATAAKLTMLNERTYTVNDRTVAYYFLALMLLGVPPLGV